MTTELVPIDQLERMAAAFAASNMFGAKTKEQALSLLLLANAEGVHPAIAMRDFDIINGRPAKKAEAMHRSFLAAGGQIEWHALTDALADATFSHPQGGTARITWDMERAKKAGLGGKDMYGKYTRQMLRSRVVSEGCRTVYPAATSGLYVPEEVQHFEPVKEKDMGKAVVVTEPAPSQATPTEPPTQPAGDAAKINFEQEMDLAQALSDCDKGAEAVLLKSAGITKLGDLPAADLPAAMKAIAQRKAKIHAKAEV
jgi:hypothetical protein